MLNRKFRITALICALALGLGLLVVGKNAKAQANPVSAPPPAANASAPAAASNVEEKIPPISMPRLASLQIRVPEDQKKYQSSIVKDRDARDTALQKAFAKRLAGPVSEEELAKLNLAISAIYKVCNIGTDYIQWRLKKNGDRSSIVNFLSGLTGVGAAATGIINTSKALGLTTGALQSYNTGIAEDGDSGHNNAQLRKIQEDVRFELATGVNNYNKALLMSTKGAEASQDKYRHLQAAVLEIHNACAFF